MLRLMSTNETGEIIFEKLGIMIKLFLVGRGRNRSLTELDSRFPFQYIGPLQPGTKLYVEIKVPRRHGNKILVAFRKQYPEGEHEFVELYDVTPYERFRTYKLKIMVGERGYIPWPRNQVFIIFAGKTTLNFVKVSLPFQRFEDYPESAFVLQHQLSGDIELVYSDENFEWPDRYGFYHKIKRGPNFICRTYGIEPNIHALEKFFQSVFDPGHVPELDIDEVNWQRVVKNPPVTAILDKEDPEVESTTLSNSNNGGTREILRVRSDLLQGKYLYTGPSFAFWDFAMNTGYSWTVTPGGKIVLVKIHYSHLQPRPVYADPENSRSLERFQWSFYEPGEILLPERVRFGVHTKGPKAGQPRWEGVNVQVVSNSQIFRRGADVFPELLQQQSMYQKIINDL